MRLCITELFLPIDHQRETLCDACRARFSAYHLSKQSCPGCGHPLNGELLCSECQAWKNNYGQFLHHRPLFHYNEAMAEYMSLYKFQGLYQLRMVFQHVVQMAIKQEEYDLLVPIPVAPTTLRTRGFNQVEGFLEGMQFHQLLTTIDDHKARQSARTRQERLVSQQPFQLNNNVRVTGQHILLVDDVYTTGRTLYHAADLLWQAGCQRVKTLSLAR